MKRKIIILALGLSLALAGCSGDNEKGAGQEKEISAETDKEETEDPDETEAAVETEEDKDEESEPSLQEINDEESEPSLQEIHYLSEITMCGATFQIPEGFYATMDLAYDKCLYNEAGDLLHIAVSDYVEETDEECGVWTGFDHPVRSFGTGPMTYELEVNQKNEDGQSYRLYVRAESESMSEDEIKDLVEKITDSVDPAGIDLSDVMEMPLTEYGTIDLYNE